MTSLERRPLGRSRALFEGIARTIAGGESSYARLRAGRSSSSSARVAPRSRTPTGGRTSTTAWATASTCSGTRRRSSGRRWRRWSAGSAGTPRSRTGSPARSVSSSRRSCRRSSSSASRAPAPRRPRRRCGWLAPRPGVISCSSSRGTTTGGPTISAPEAVRGRRRGRPGRTRRACRPVRWRPCGSSAGTIPRASTRRSRQPETVSRP